MVLSLAMPQAPDAMDWAPEGADINAVKQRAKLVSTGRSMLEKEGAFVAVPRVISFLDTLIGPRSNPRPV